MEQGFAVSQPLFLGYEAAGIVIMVSFIYSFVSSLTIIYGAGFAISQPHILC